MMRRMGIVLLGFVFALCFGGFAAHAQVSGSLSYGSALIGTISATSPLVFLAFPASAGDVITVNVIGLTPGFDPSVSLLNPSQQPIAASDNDPATPGALDARVAQRLDATGTYALLVGGVNSTTGDFLVKLNGLPTGQPPILNAGSATVAYFTANPLPQFLSIPADPASALGLTLAAQPASFAFAAQVFGANGALIAEFDGAPQASLNLPAGTGNALVILHPSGPDGTGAVEVSAGGAAVPGTASGPVATPEPVPPPPAGVCTVGSSGMVNLRAGAGTTFPVIGTLNPGNYLAVQGVSPDRGWYAVNASGQQAWVSATVASLNGPCGNLATVQPPAGSAPAATQPIQPTPGIGLIESPTPIADTAPPTAAVSPAPAAPPDNDYQVELDRNNGGSFSQQISFPDGDRSDRITVSVSNFDSANNFAQFAVTLACTGTGTEFVRWGENQSQNLACGQNLTLVLNNESNQRFLNVTLPNGSGPAFVNYTLVFVKTG